MNMMFSHVFTVPPSTGNHWIEIMYLFHPMSHAYEWFFSDGCHGDQGLGIWILDLQIPAGALILQRQLFLKRSCNDDIPTIQRHKTHRFQIRKILRGSFGRLDPTTRQRFTWCLDQVDGRDQPTAWTPLGQQRRWRFSTERAKCWSLLKKDELRAICWRLRRSSVWNLYLCIKI